MIFFEKKNQRGIEQILSLISLEDTIKEYEYKDKILEIEKGKMTIRQQSDIRKKIVYIQKSENIEYIENFHNVDTCFDIIKMLGRKVRRCENPLLCILKSGKKINLQDIHEIENNVKIFSIAYPEYKIECIAVNYREALLLGKGILEKRCFDHIIVNILKGNTDIGNMIYIAMPSYQQLETDIKKKIEWYKKWIRLRQKTLQEVKNIKSYFCPADTAAKVIHEIIGHTCEKDIYLERFSTTIKCGKLITNRNITVYDMAYEKGIITNTLYDDYGKYNEKIKIIDKGILVGLIGASGDRMIGTFNDELPQIRMRNLFLEGKGKIKSYDEEEYIIINEIRDSYIENKEVVFYVSKSTLIEKGQSYRLSEFIIRKPIEYMLNKIYAIEQKGQYSHLFVCRKKGAITYLSSCVPPIWINLEV